MNRKEREAAAFLAARWEWSQGGSASEATAFGACARDLCETLGLTEADMSFPRTYTVWHDLLRSDDDSFLDELGDYYDQNGSSAFIDLIGNLDEQAIRRTLATHGGSNGG